MIAASIDIGTNTTRLAIVDTESFKVIEKFRYVTRLGEGFKDKLNEPAMKRVIDVLKNYKNIMGEYHVEKFRGVATSVVREALNGQHFIDRILNETELQIDIISGDEEAELTFYGVLSVLDKDIKNFILLDIGGGSNEYIIVKNRKILDSVSLKFGVVFLYEKFIKNDPPTKYETECLEEEIRKNIFYVKEKFNRYNLENLKFVGTAGTVTTLSAIQLKLKEYIPEKINNNIVDKKFLHNLIDEMICMNNVERLKKFKIEKGREDVIIPGLHIIKQSMDIFGFESITSIDSSLLEGIAFKLVE